MDVISHGLWGWLAFGRQKRSRYAPALVFGMLPDLLAFVPFFIHARIQGFQFTGPPPLEIVPSWVFLLYNLGHSLIVFGLFYLIVGRYNREVAFCSLAWLLHILVDIPTHAADYFPTRFLYPLNDFVIDGLPWDTPIIWFSNLTLLVVLCAVVFLARLREKRSLAFCPDGRQGRQPFISPE